ncbi:MAG: hypothetical protein JNL82_25360 [Myxococcales bacterium]|nr:hypothetical protein [Myxococcales bacterium]
MRRLAPLLLAACGAFTEVPRTYSSAGNAAVLYSDDFSGAQLGEHWRPTGPGARLVDGALEVENLHNHPLWLDIPLPDDLRIEFDARAFSDEGDIKVEFAGDGKSYARAASYKASGYVVIFGGWNNSTNAVVRRDEHGGDRRTVARPKVEPDRRYHFVITRRDGSVHWELDGEELLTYDDPDPLVGPGQQHFAFGGWEARVQFDNLVIQSI